MILQECAKYMDQYKKYFGLHKYKILVQNKYRKIRDGEGYAEVDPDIFEFTIKVSLSPEFKKMNESKQKSVLIHELIHARIRIKDKLIEDAVESLEYHFEEELANDLEKGFVKLLGGI